MWIARLAITFRFCPLVFLFLYFTLGVAQKTAPAGTLVSRQAIVTDPVNHQVYAVDPEGNSLWIIGGVAQAPIKVAVGKEPIAVDVNAKTGTVYVLNHDSGTVSVVSGKTQTVLATVNVGARPYVLAVDSANDKVFVSNIFSDQVTVIDGFTNATRTQKLGSADAMAFNARTGRLYLLGYESSSLTVLDGADGSIRKLPAGAIHLWGMAVDAARNTVFVTRIGSNELAVLNEENNTLKTVPTGRLPSSVAVESATNRIYVANYGEDTVTVIDGQKLTPVATVKVGRQPQAVLVDATSGLVYVANTHGDSVTVIDGSSNSVVATLPAGKSPYALALGEQKLCVANQGSGHAFTCLDIGHVHQTTK